MKLELIAGMLFVKPALLLAVAAALALALRRQSAAARHAVWACAIIGTLTLPFLQVIVPPVAVPLLTQSLELPTAPDAAGARDESRDRPTPAADPLTASRLDPAAARPDGPSTVAVLSGVVLGAWLVIALLLGGARVLAEVRVRRVVLRARPAADARVVRVFRDTARQTGVCAPIELRMSADITSPAVAGLLHPVVLLPDAGAAWQEADLAAIFAHELGHAARRDGIVNLLADLAAVLYWCNPVIRLVRRRMSVECERACDDRVLRAGARADAYADVLLRVAVATRVRGEQVSPAIPMVRLSELESRVRAILDTRVSRRPLAPRNAAAFAGLIAAATLTTAGLTPVRLLPPLAPSATFPLPTATLQQLPEPDRLGDSLASPASERVPLGNRTFSAPPSALTALEGPDSALVRRLIIALDRRPAHDADLVRERAAWALAQVRNGRIIEPLLAQLQSGDWRVQAYAAWALATAHDPRAVAPLLPLLAHPVWRLRAMAAYALRESADVRAEPAMQHALTDPAWQVRLEAVQYFAQRGGPALTDRLTPFLHDRHIAVRNAAARALHR